MSDSTSLGGAKRPVTWLIASVLTLYGWVAGGQEPGVPEPHAESQSCTADVACCDGSDWFLPLKDRLQVRGDYVLWWLDGFAVPALVTTSPANTPQPVAGVLGQAGTGILFGNESLDENVQSGGGFSLCYWLAGCSDVGLEFDYLGLGQHHADHFSSSDGSTILARPFFNLETGREDASLIAFPNLLNGEVGVTASTEYDAAQVLLRRAVGGTCRYDLQVFVGYQYQRLDDTLRINDRLVSMNANSGLPVGSTMDTFDLFDTSNEFHGGQIGLASQFHWGCCSLELLGKLALGNTNADVRIDGSTTNTAVNGSTAIIAGGLLALPSNMGTFSASEFSAVPELSCRVICWITCHLQASVGYSFVYWSGVARPGDQIDRDVYPSELPPGPVNGVPRSDVSVEFTDFFAQGLRLGLEYQY